ncbi:MULTISPECIES: hypothetical protein [Mesorhizobium]|uniref:hypothetical protein n=1 Tax=Mesorhizobium australicum TaxID=536018 RepID=UPI00333AFBAA
MSIAQKIKTALSASRKATNELADGLTSVRDRIAKLGQERQAIEGADCSLDQALERLAGFMNYMRQPLNDYYVGQFLQPSGRPDVGMNTDQAARLALALGADAWAKAMEGKIRQALADRPGYTDAERAAKLDAIDAELLDLELVEESLIRNAEQAGFEVLRRHDANPAAVLAHDSALPT